MTLRKSPWRRLTSYFAKPHIVHKRRFEQQWLRADYDYDVDDDDDDADVDGGELASPPQTTTMVLMPTANVTTTMMLS